MIYSCLVFSVIAVQVSADVDSCIYFRVIIVIFGTRYNYCCCCCCWWCSSIVQTAKKLRETTVTGTAEQLWDWERGTDSDSILPGGHVPPGPPCSAVPELRLVSFRSSTGIVVMKTRSANQVEVKVWDIVKAFKKEKWSVKSHLCIDYFPA